MDRQGGSAGAQMPGGLGRTPPVGEPGASWRPAGLIDEQLIEVAGDGLAEVGGHGAEQHDPGQSWRPHRAPSTPSRPAAMLVSARSEAVNVRSPGGVNW